MGRCLGGEGMKAGDRVRIESAPPQRDGHPLVGKTGTIRKYSYLGGSRDLLCWDVLFDSPMPDGRELVWFSTRELEVIEA